MIRNVWDVLFILLVLLIAVAVIAVIVTAISIHNAPVERIHYTFGGYDQQRRRRL